ncbi:MAG: ATP-binding protein [Bacteroidales bacterium]|nr:ATP-binding protein [Bacteroidales bacterium]
MENLLHRYNPWWEKGYLDASFIQRDKIFETLLHQLNNRQIVFITGLRRIGKTTFLKMLIQTLIHKHNINSKYVLYICMDDYMLINKSIIDIVEEYRKVHKLGFGEHIYLFFDEITYKKDYEIQLKNLFDNHNVKIFASSSSASLLKSKRPYLTGRSVIFELLPLDFNEYLLFKNIKIKKADAHLIPGYFEEFLKTGGIPEYVLKGDPSYLQTLVDDIIFKDIAAVNNIKDPRILIDYFLLLMERAGKLVSINKIATILQISPDTSKRYLTFFSDAYLVYLLGRHGKTNERLLSAKKVYAPDLGIRTSYTGFRDKGSLFENYVFLQIKGLKPSYIYQDTAEIDFFTENKILIEVKYHHEALSEKQNLLFNKINAKKKIIIRSNADLEQLVSPDSSIS